VEVTHIGEQLEHLEVEAPQDTEVMAKMLKILLEDFDTLTKLLVLKALFGIEPEDLMGGRPRC
jgi:hypothetical protein